MMVLILIIVWVMMTIELVPNNTGAALEPDGCWVKVIFIDIRPGQLWDHHYDHSNYHHYDHQDKLTIYLNFYDLGGGRSFNLGVETVLGRFASDLRCQESF